MKLLTDGSNNFEVYKHAWGNYYVSNFGNVFNAYSRKVRTHDTKGDYCRIRISGLDDYQPSVCVHRIVATLFIPNDDPRWKWYVNHKDGNKHNNHVDNLEWVTHLENMDHAKKHDLVAYERAPYEVRQQIIKDYKSLAYTLDDLVEKYKEYNLDKLYISDLVKKHSSRRKDGTCFKKYPIKMKEQVYKDYKNKVSKKEVIEKYNLEPNHGIDCFDNYIREKDGYVRWYKKPSRFTEEECYQLKELHDQGWSYRKIARKYGSEHHVVKKYIGLVS